MDLALGSSLPTFVWWGAEGRQLYNDAGGALLGAKHPAAMGAPARACWAEAWEVLGPLEARVRASDEGQSAAEVVLRVDRRGAADEACFTVAMTPIRGEGCIEGILVQLVETADRAPRDRRRLEHLTALDRGRTSFFRHLAHELGTPLTLELGPLEDVLADRVVPLAPEHRERLELSRRSGLELRRLVGTLLDYARLEAGRAEANFEPTDLAALTRDLVSQFRKVAQRAGLTLDVRCDPLPGPVYVDRSMWAQVVFHLVSHALGHTSDGGVVVELLASPDEVTLEVRDSGDGLGEEALAGIFEPFHPRPAGGDEARGSGIGLALVKEIARVHGGRVEAESALGRGTTVSVVLPRAARPLEGAPFDTADAVTEPMAWRAQTPAGATEASAVPVVEVAPARRAAERRPGKVTIRARRPRERVLLVDDNEDLRGYVARLLGAEFEVEALADGRAALASALASPPALVLADVMMPELDGIELVRALRADPGTRTVPIVLLSARAAEDARIEGLGAGADDYLVKPFSARELLARVTTHMALDRARSEAAEHEQARREAAEASRRQLHEIFWHAPAFILVTRGEAHDVELMNPAFARLVGQSSGAPFVGRRAAEAVPALSRQGFIRILDQVFERGEPIVGVERRVDLEPGEGAPGDEVYVDFVAQPLRDEAGRVSGILTHAVDVSERVRARRRTEEERARLALVTDAIPALVAYVGRDLRYEFANAQHEAWLGIPPTSFVGRAMAEVLGEEAVAKVRPHLDRVLAGERVSFEAKIEYPVGERWILAKYVPDRDPDGAIRGFVSLVHDITDRKLAEEALRRSDERFRLARLATRDVIWDRDLDTGEVSTADGPRVALGYERGDVEEPGTWWIDRIHPDDRERVRRSIDVALEGAVDLWTEEYRLERADGTYAAVLDRGYVLRDDDGRPRRMVGALSDLTERRMLEEKMHASQRMESVGRLAGGVAHEVNNALTGVLGFANLLLGSLAPHDPAREDVRLIVTAAERAAQIARQLLAFSRRQIMVPKLLDLGELVQEFAPMLRQAVGRNNTLAIRGSTTPATVKADRLQLEQVLLNLALNARDAMPHGGTLSVALDVVTSPEDAEGAVVVITVADTGHGMGEEVRRQLFEPFFTTKPVGRGTGLGLPMVYGIVKQSGGHIDVESEPGEGATFRIRLPWVDTSDALAGEGRRPTPHTPVPEPPRVVVLDDEPSVLGYLGRLLRSRGYTVHECATAEEALTRCELLGGRLDVLVADLVMPGCTGRDVSDRLRAAHPHVRVIYVSGFSDDEMRRRGLLAPGDAFLQKPFRSEALLAHVERAIASAQGSAAPPGALTGG